MLQHGISINTTDSRGCTPLILATQYGQATLVGYLLGKCARKDFTDADGDNALHWAAFKGIFLFLVYKDVHWERDLLIAAHIDNDK